MKFLKLIVLINALLLACSRGDLNYTDPQVGGLSINPVSQSALDQIVSITEKYPACGKAKLLDRSLLGRARGYYYGTLYSMARSICRPGDSIKSNMLLGNIDTTKDAVYGFGSQVKLYASLNVADEQHLKSTYSILLSHGLIESNGDYREGVDTTNSSSNTAETAEAGLYQTSYSIRYGMEKSAVLATENLELEYQANRGKCETQLFDKDRLSKPYSAIVGSGVGADFQRLLRSCPALAVEHAAITIRQDRRHYQPLVKLTSVPLTDCYPVIEEVYDYIIKNRDTICSAILEN